MFKFKVADWYNIHKGFTLSLNPGVTVLTGPNGAGKTTLLRQIREKGMEQGAVILSHNNLSDGGNAAMQRYLESGVVEGLATMASSSEGEGIAYVFGRFLPKVRPAMQSAKNSGKPLFVLIDAIDSGASIDRQRKIAGILSLMEQDCVNNEFYIVITTNCYEITKGRRCLDPRTGKDVVFKNYEEYADYICGYFEKGVSKK